VMCDLTPNEPSSLSLPETGGKNKGDKQ